MIEHVVSCLRPVVDEVIVVTSAELELPELEARVVIDGEIGGGPLVGIREGLAAATSEFAFVTSVDAPFLNAKYVEALFSLGAAAAPVSEDHVQVLSAIYPCAAWRNADDLLRRGSRRPLRLLEELDYTAVSSDSAVAWCESEGPCPWHGFNEPKEYLEAVRALDPTATVELEFLGRAANRTGPSRGRYPVGTLGEVLALAESSTSLTSGSSLIENGRLRKSHLVCLGGRALVRDLSIPLGPDELVSVIDALAGG